MITKAELLARLREEEISVPVGTMFPASVVRLIEWAQQLPDDMPQDGAKESADKPSQDTVQPELDVALRVWFDGKPSRTVPQCVDLAFNFTDLIRAKKGKGAGK